MVLRVLVYKVNVDTDLDECRAQVISVDVCFESIQQRVDRLILLASVEYRIEAGQNRPGCSRSLRLPVLASQHLIGVPRCVSALSVGAIAQHIAHR